MPVRGVLVDALVACEADNQGFATTLGHPLGPGRWIALRGFREVGKAPDVMRRDPVSRTAKLAGPGQQSSNDLRVLTFAVSHRVVVEGGLDTESLVRQRDPAPDGFQRSSPVALDPDPQHPSGALGHGPGVL